jgi:hypothetical protein
MREDGMGEEKRVETINNHKLLMTNDLEGISYNMILW